MSATLTVTGIGTVGELDNFTASRDSIPAALGQPTGSTGSATFSAETSVDDANRSEWLINNPAALVHVPEVGTGLGIIDGKITSISVNNFVTTGTIETVLSDLAVERTIATAGYDSLARKETVPFSYSLFVDSIGREYLTTFGTVDIRTATGEHSSYYTTTGNISDVAENLSNGFIAIADVGNSTIRVNDSLVSFQFAFGSVGSGNGQFASNAFIYVAFDSTGRIFAADSTLGRIQRFSSTGTYQTQWAVPAGITGIDIDPATDTVYAFVGGVVRTYTTSGVGGSVLTDDTGTTIAAQNGVVFRDKLYVTNGFGAPYSNPRYSIYVLPTNSLINTYSVPDLPTGYDSAFTNSISANANSLYLTPRVSRVSPAENFYYLYKMLTPTPALSGMFEYIIHSVVDTDVVYRSVITTDPIVLAPGWTGNVWQKLNDLGTAYGLDIFAASEIINDVQQPVYIYITPMGTFTSYIAEAGPLPTLNIRTTGNAQKLKITYQNPTLLNDYTRNIYSAYDDNNKQMSVASGKVAEYVLTTNAYPSSLKQPVVTDVFTQVTGAYHVSGADNLPVVSTEWTAYGGKVTAAIGPDPNQITVTLTGPTQEIPGVPGPYVLEANDGQNSYATFNLAGIGLKTSPTELIMHTGADPIKTPTEFYTVSPDNIFIQSRHQAYDRGVWLGDLMGAPAVELSATLPISSALGFHGTSISYITYANCVYRVLSSTLNNESVNITAVRHTTSGDVTPLWTGKTAGNEVTLWDNAPSENQIISPMRVV